MADTMRKPIPTFFGPQPDNQSENERPPTEGLQSNDTPQSLNPTELPKRNPWTSIDARDAKPTLSPSPAFLEASKASKDDIHLNTRSPVTPKRPNTAPRGLSLQLSMPPRDVSSSSTANLSTDITNRAPLSPKLDPSPSYATSVSALPRRSRGLDYTRACTNLHHSTLAEQSSPDSSPVIGGSRGMNIPRRSQVGTTGPDSPMFPGSLWSNVAGSEKGMVSSSLGSVNMMDSASDSESSDDDLMRDDDTIHMTPQIGKHHSNPLTNALSNSPAISSPGMDTMGPFGQAASNLLSFQRRTRRGRSTRQSSSSASNTSTMPSPAPASPPLLKSIESSMSNGYFPNTANVAESSRRESLSLGTNDLHISDSADGENAAPRDGDVDPLGIPIMTTNSTMDERRSVIRRAVTRRSNMLPKPKTFARIRATLQEEGSPLDYENKREAEVIRQVKESDNSPESTAPVSQPATTASSPYLAPSISNTDAMDDLSDMMGAGSETPSERRPSLSFGKPPIPNGPDFWNNTDSRVRTPPPQFLARGSSSAMSEDINMDTPASSMYSMGPRYSDNANNSSPSRSSTPQPTVGEITRKTLGKRRRDDDLDPNMFKRRAVSPGLSLQNSPVLPPSPMQRDGGYWAMKANRETPTGHAAGERANSNGSANGSGLVGKKVGLQGMTDTNDGLMNMTIDN